jgi:signal transduction histidine kinase
MSPYLRWHELSEHISPDFLEALSHELRNVAACIRLGLDTIKHCGPHCLQQSTDLIQVGTDRMANLLDEIDRVRSLTAANGSDPHDTPGQRIESRQQRVSDNQSGTLIFP